MEKQKNQLYVARSEKDLLPIEQEFLSGVKKKLQSQLGIQISSWKKHEMHPLYDCFLLVIDNRPFFLKVNLSPDIPNFWPELIKNNFSFHPKIVAHSESDDEFNFICFEVPKGMFASDISNYPLSPKLKIQDLFIKGIKEMHSTVLSDKDNTIDTFNSFLPRESMMICEKFPLVQLFSSAKSAFAKSYKSNPVKCGLCHFDISPENAIYTGSDFKFINFEYASNSNIYLDILLAKETLNCSDLVFEQILEKFFKEERLAISKCKDASNIFNFGYFNSKILSEYITFGLRNPAKLKYWINQSEVFYGRIFDQLFVDKKLDKLIRDFYYLWK